MPPFALDAVGGVDRPLQEHRRAGPLRFPLEDPDELLTDGLALLLGIDDARESLEELVRGIHDTEVRVGKERPDAIGLPPFRMRPVSTYIGTRRSPIARVASAAQTDESTPPESAITTLSSPAASHISLTARSINFSTFTILLSHLISDDLFFLHASTKPM